MSYDVLSGSRQCDHLQLLERYTVDAFDFRTLHYVNAPQFNMRAPINGASMVRLYFKDVLVDPAHPQFGYDVVTDPNRIQAGYAFQKIMFRSPVRMTKPLVEVTYLTMQDFCLKCGGTGVVVDWSVSPSGALNHVSGAKKLAQQALKYITCSKNPFNPNLTTPIRKYLNNKFGVAASDTDITTAVRNALSSYQSIQRAQSSVQAVDPTELIKTVLSVNSQQDASDPTVVNIFVSLQAYGANDAIPLNFALQTT